MTLAARVWPRSLLIYSLLLAVSACQRPVEFVISGNTMGTTYSIKVVRHRDDINYGAATLTETDLHRLIDQRLRLVNSVMSIYDPSSELSSFNAKTLLEPQELSLELFALLSSAKQISEQTGGAFDITVGPLVNAYGFGPKQPTTQPPTKEKLREAQALVGFHNLILSPETQTAAKQIAGLQLDLGAIAKGYGVDVIADLLSKQGYQNYLVEIGGEVKAQGVNTQKVPWRVGIEQPNTGIRKIQLVLPLAGQALATSGDYRNFYWQAGRRVAHAIDPRTGTPVDHNLASVSVVHKDCATADALATALLVMGPEAGLKFSEEQSLSAHFIVREQNGSYHQFSSRTFQELLVASDL